ncbi:hypothetical protein HKBW3S47_02087, partial [Candidatus Hakubella thermalkaliphila]
GCGFEQDKPANLQLPAQEQGSFLSVLELPEVIHASTGV